MPTPPTPIHAMLAAKLAESEDDLLPVVEEVVDWLETARPSEVVPFFRQFVTTCDDHVVRLGWLEAIAAQRANGKRKPKRAPVEEQPIQQAAA